MITNEQLKYWAIRIGSCYVVIFILCAIMDAAAGIPMQNAFGQAIAGTVVFTLVFLAIKKDLQQEKSHKELLKIPDKKK